MVVFLIVLLVSLTNSIQTGIRVGFTQQSIDQIKEKGLPWIFQQLDSIPIPDQSSSIGKGFFKITADLQKIVVSDLKINSAQTSIKFQSPNGLQLKIQGLYGVLNFDWKSKFPLGHGHGTGRAQIQKTEIFAQASFMIQKGRPVIQIPTIHCLIKKLDIHIHGSILTKVAAWIIDLLQGKIKDKIQSLIAGKVKDKIQSELNQIFTSMPLKAKLPHIDIEISYEFTEKIQVTQNYLQVGMSGLFTYSKNPNLNPPIPLPTPMTEFDPEGKGVQFMISDFSINSAFYSFYELGKQYNISSIDSKVFFDTTSISVFIPGLQEKYGSQIPCFFICQLGAPPSITNMTESGKVGGVASIRCSLNVQKEGQAIGFQIGFSFEASAKISEWFVKGNLESVDISSLDIYNDHFGVDVSGVRSVLNYLIGEVLPIVNDKVFGEGIPLPKVKDIDLNDSLVIVEDGYLYAQATPVWNFRTENFRDMMKEESSFIRCLDTSVCSN